MDPKPRPNRDRYLQVLRRMTPDQKLRKVFELGDMGRTLFYEGLRRRHPEFDEARLRVLYRKGLDRCHNRNY
jgi:DNA-binding PadR family transcriptional regulator